MTADQKSHGRALYCASTNSGSGLTGAQIDELERVLVTCIEVLSERARRIRELRRRLCTSTRGRDVVRTMLDDRLAATRDEFAAVVRAHRAIGAAGYGVCARCNTPIGFTALLEAPARTHCQACASAGERT